MLYRLRSLLSIIFEIFTLFCNLYSALYSLFYIFYLSPPNGMFIISKFFFSFFHKKTFHLSFYWTYLKLNVRLQTVGKIFERVANFNLTKVVLKNKKSLSCNEFLKFKFNFFNSLLWSYFINFCKHPDKHPE